MTRRKIGFAALIGLFAAVIPGVTHAQTMPACNALPPDPVSGATLPPPLYISGSTAMEPLLKTIGPKLASLANGYTLVYLKDGSCSGVNRLNGNGLITQNMFYITASYNAATTPTPPLCTVPAGGQLGDLVLSDVDPTLCPGGAKPANVKDFTGPVNNMVFVVPTTSTQTAVSMEMAYLIFGDGQSGMVSPWTDPMFYFIRTPDSGTRAMITQEIATTTHNWQGVSADPTTGKAFGSGDIISHVSMQTGANAEKTIGIVGSDVLDSGNNRSSVKSLAFRALHQRYAYWPDSTVNSKDKRNVRDGRYAIWGNVHMLAVVDNGGVPTSPGAAFFTSLLQGTLASPPATFDVTDVIVDSHLVPMCAMNVTHDIEGGPEKPYSSATPCGCYFDNRATGTPPASCTACPAGTCTTGVCRRGFCEAK